MQSTTKNIISEQVNEIPSDTTIYNSGQKIVIKSGGDKNSYNFNVEFLGINYSPELLNADLTSYDGTPNEKLIIKIELGRAAGAGPVEAALSRGKSQMSNEGIYYTYYENGWGADEVEFRFYLSDNREVQKAVLGGIDGKRRVTFAGNKWFALELNRV